MFLYYHVSNKQLKGLKVLNLKNDDVQNNVLNLAKTAGVAGVVIVVLAVQSFYCVSLSGELATAKSTSYGLLQSKVIADTKIADLEQKLASYLLEPIKTPPAPQSEIAVSTPAPVGSVNPGMATPPQLKPVNPNPAGR